MVELSRRVCRWMIQRLSRFGRSEIQPGSLRALVVVIVGPIFLVAAVRTVTQPVAMLQVRSAVNGCAVTVFYGCSAALSIFQRISFIGMVSTQGPCLSDPGP